VESEEERAESGEESVETGGIGRTALLLTNTNATGDYQKADLANRGGFATDHPNGLCDADEDQSSQVYVAIAVPIVPKPLGNTTD